MEAGAHGHALLAGFAACRTRAGRARTPSPRKVASGPSVHPDENAIATLWGRSERGPRGPSRIAHRPLK